MVPNMLWPENMPSILYHQSSQHEVSILKLWISSLKGCLEWQRGPRFAGQPARLRADRSQAEARRILPALQEALQYLWSQRLSHRGLEFTSSLMWNRTQISRLFMKISNVDCKWLHKISNTTNQLNPLDTVFICDYMCIRWDVKLRNNSAAELLFCFLLSYYLRLVNCGIQ